MSKPRVLYAFCGTGQGHMAKAMALESELRKRYNLEFLVSALSNPLLLDVDHAYEGVSIVFNSKAELDILSTYNSANAKQFARDAISVDLKKYDFVISDHESITTTSAYLSGYENIFTLSHQASFTYSETPREEIPLSRWHDKALFNMIVNGYCRNRSDRIYGLHFEKYHENIFCPLLREEVLQLNPTEDGNCIVYLPKNSKNSVMNVLSRFPKQKFRVFDPKHTRPPESFSNITFCKTDKEAFMRHLESCSGAIVNAGFELPSELMYLKKNFLAIPQKLQYEQECNAAALRLLGARTSKELTLEAVEEMLNSNENYRQIEISTPSDILDRIEQKVQ